MKTIIMTKSGDELVSVWQYNGVAPYDIIKSWCKEHIPNDSWNDRFDTFYFYKEKYYTMFLLRWA